MTPGVLGLVLVASVAHALWNLVAKSVSGRGFAFVLAYHGLSAILLLPIAGWLVVSGAVAVDWRLLAASAVSAVIHIAYSVSLQSGYDHAPLGIVYPTARGAGPVITMLVAVALLGERPTGPELLGGLVVIAGIALVTAGGGRRRRMRVAGSSPEAAGGADVDPDAAADARGSSGTGRGFSGNDRGGVLRGLAWGGLIGTFIAAYTLWDDFAVNHITDSPLLYFAVSECVVAVLMTVGMIVCPGARARRADLAAIAADHRAAVVAVAVLSPLAYLLVLYSMQQAPVSLVAPVRETSIVVGTLLAWWVFGERNLGPKLLGAAVVVTGIGCIALG
ncbi:EamA-like transporter family protein [Brevibacterium sanguinis]|uniref:EamA-like transporter family protein n=2 Tax=Brevibacterium TaxID=1696 RepID=A0A366ICI0_9MICO|nr:MULTISPECIES: EamA family transporter [Brevibacterium]RBP61491.1 EamA-like transporter family protein [Brevibacterium sanguinis]RBP68585.1 EamA-like transporter family protein [Brevibacterium celere]